jgi:hypothetical protein
VAAGGVSTTLGAVSGGGKLANPSLGASRPIFKSSAQRAEEDQLAKGGKLVKGGLGGNGKGDRAGGAGAAAAAVGEEEMTQGLQYSVCRVQHDNPWLEAMLAEVELGQVQPQPGGAAVRDGDGYLEQLAERSQDERRRAELSGDSAAAVPTGAAGSPGATGKGDAAEEAASRSSVSVAVDAAGVTRASFVSFSGGGSRNGSGFGGSGGMSPAQLSAALSLARNVGSGIAKEVAGVSKEAIAAAATA